ncbi:potassium transporter TrkA [Couchioplanes caeruleus]|uniref:potassium transporter TrkA n=1 Tax=Couchioplanes caeruleus TaxID=56438 RepID=UPI0020BD4EF8|nr:potassium transporter TrkA [Couchioplanes caeruleus]UQU67607.1 potassium transporter TrkA [Couchioplanes caeruleus]
MDVESTPLPGIGTCRTFHTATGHRVGVVTHHAGGRRELVHSISDDPDATCSLTLTRTEATALAGLLGILDVIDVEIAGPAQHTPPAAPR